MEDIIMDNAKFSDFLVEGPNGLSLVWEYIGEGRSGDYDPEDPEDVPLLRASLQYNGEVLDSGSYCTFAQVSTDREKLAESAQYLMKMIEVDSENLRFNHRVMEQWTWLNYDPDSQEQNRKMP
jgi:hypothetical protein